MLEDIVTIVVLGDKITFKLLKDKQNTKQILSKQGMSPKDFFITVEKLLLDKKIEKVEMNIINNISLDINNY